jgi:type IV pilus modification protein PilV
MNPRRSQSGFSLVEVMVAVFVLAVGLVGLARGITTALVSGKEAETYSQAVELAANRVELLRTDDYFSDGETEGTEGPLRWRQTVSPANANGLHQVEVAVERVAGNVQVYTLRTFLYQTPTDRPADKEKDRRDKRSRKGTAKGP